MTLVEVTAWWDTMTVNFGDGEKPTVVAAIMTKVKQIVDSIEGFTADADEVLNAPIYREALYVTNNLMISQGMPMRTVMRTGAVANAAAVMAGDVEWFSALVRGQAKIREAGKVVLGMETESGKNASNVALTAAAVGAAIPVSETERIRVDSLNQTEQRQLLQSLNLEVVRVGIRNLRADARFAPHVAPSIQFGAVQYAEALLIHPAVRKALLVGVAPGQMDQSDAWFLHQLIQQRGARLELMYKQFTGDLVGASVEMKKFQRMMEVEPGKNGVEKGAWARKGELWIVDCAFQLLGKRDSNDMWRYLRPGNFDQMVKMIERMHALCAQMIPDVFTADLLARNVEQIWAFETAYKCREDASTFRGVIGMTEAEATVAYFDHWTAWTYYQFALEVTAFKTDTSLTMEFPAMKYYLGEPGENNTDVGFLALLPAQKARVINAQARLLELKKGDYMAGIQRLGFRRVHKANSENIKKTYSCGHWGKLIYDREAAASGAFVDPTDKRDPDPKGGGKGKGKGKDKKGGKEGKSPSRGCFQFAKDGTCSYGVGCRFEHGDPTLGNQQDGGQPPTDMVKKGQALIEKKSSVWEVEQTKSDTRSEVWCPKGTFDGEKVDGGWGGPGSADGGFYGHEVTQPDGSKVYEEASYGDQSWKQTRPAYYRGPRGDGKFDYNKEDIDLAAFGRPPNQVGLDKAEMKALRTMLATQYGHRPTKNANNKLGPNGTDSRPWACLWELTQALHPQCSEVPGCSKQENCFNAHMMEDTKAKVGAWDSQFAGPGLEMAIRKCLPRFDAYMRTIPASGSGYMSQHRLGGPGSTPPRMVGQDGDTGYPAGPDPEDRKAVKRSYKATTEYAPPKRHEGHKSFNREREERVMRKEERPQSVSQKAESWQDLHLDHWYDNGESDEHQRAREWVTARVSEVDDMTGMPELMSDDSSSSDGSDIGETEGPDMGRHRQRGKSRRKYGARFQAWAAKLGVTDIPAVVLSLQKKAGTGGYTMVDEEDWASSEDEEVSDWPFIAPAQDRTGADSYPQKPPPSRIARTSMTVGGEKFAASREEVLGRERSVFHRTRDSVAWVGEATAFEGAPQGAYTGPTAVTTFADLYPKGMTVTEANGPWVQRLLRRTGQMSIYWTGTEVQHQVEEWERLNAYDLKMELQLEKNGRGGQHRKRCATLILRQEDLLGGGAIIWDLRPYQRRRKARLAPEADGIRPQPSNEKPAFRLKTERLEALLRLIGVTDEYKIQQLTSSGVFTHSEARRDTVLAVNYPLVAKYAQHCSDLARKEEEEGILSEAFLGCPFAPCRMHSQQVVEGDKPRVVADLGGPHWGEEDNSINAGIAFWDERRLARLNLTSPILFGEIVGILASSGVPISIGKSDWSRYYRQVAKPPSEYWHQVIWSQRAGCNYDKSVTFGDGAGPCGAHVGTDSFVQLFRAEYSSRLAQVRIGNFESWPAGVEADGADIAAAMITLDAWRGEREGELRRQHPKKCGNAAWLQEQLEIFELEAFFDDSMFATAQCLFDLIVWVVLSVGEYIGLETATHKVSRGTANGRVADLDTEAWDLRREIRWCNERVGHLGILGKLINLQAQQVIDDPARLVKLVAKIHAMGEDSIVWTNGKRVASIDTTRSVIGNLFYVVLTAPEQRGWLNRPIRSMKISETVMPVLNAKYRKLARRGRKAEPFWAKCFYSKKMEECLLKVVHGAQRSGGVAFNVMERRPGVQNRSVAFVMTDAAGCRRVRDPHGGVRQLALTEQGGAGAWVVRVRGDQVGKRGGQIPLKDCVVNWMHVKWTAEQLQGHSTKQECAAANLVTRLVAEMGVQDIVEVYDSMSASRIMRRLACHKQALEEDVRDRGAIFAEFPDLRIFTLQTDRELHREADGLSKVGLLAMWGLTGEFFADRLLRGRGFVGIRRGDRIGPRL